MIIDPTGPGPVFTGCNILQAAAQKHTSLRAFAGDEGYRGTAVEFVENTLALKLNISKKIKDTFAVLPIRWIVERTFAWLGVRRMCSASVSRGSWPRRSDQIASLYRRDRVIAYRVFIALLAFKLTPLFESHLHRVFDPGPLTYSKLIPTSPVSALITTLGRSEVV